eukprot:Rmarinus@m.14980
MNAVQVVRGPVSAICMKGSAPIVDRTDVCLNLITDTCEKLMLAASHSDKRFHNKRHLKGWFNRCLLSTNAHTLLCGMILVERVLQKFGTVDQVRKSLASIPTLYFISIMIASKTLYDRPYSNKVWVAIGEDMLNLRDLNAAELEFLKFIRWNTYISSSEFEEFAARYASR